MARPHSPTLADLGPRRRGFFWWFGVLSLAALILLVVLAIVAVAAFRASTGGPVSAADRNRAIAEVEAKAHGHVTKTNCARLAGQVFCTVTVRLAHGAGCQRYLTGGLPFPGVKVPDVSKVGRRQSHC